jgi:DNA-binding transcriptional MerR regulator
VSAKERHLGTAETARRLGLSPKALRLYERHGLLAPLRSAKGWRAYGPKDIEALHRILALKRLGLNLSQIAQLLARRAIGVDELLAVQEQVLAREAARLSEALALVRDARRRLAGGKALSVDDLIALTKETSMTTKAQTDEMKAILDPLVAKHFTSNEINGLSGHSYDQQEASHQWEALIAEAKTLIAKGDPGSPEAADLARRWMALVSQFSGGDPVLAAKAKNVWSEAMADPEAAPKLPLNTEIFAFVGKAWALAKAKAAD